MSADPLPKSDVPALDLRGQFYTSQSPVQAWGTVKGRAFYFRARYEGWEFAVSPSTDDTPIFAATNREQLFIREGQFGTGKYDASFMPFDVAIEIIERCAKEYIESCAV